MQSIYLSYVIFVTYFIFFPYILDVEKTNLFQMECAIFKNHPISRYISIIIKESSAMVRYKIFRSPTNTIPIPQQFSLQFSTGTDLLHEFPSFTLSLLNYSSVTAKTIPQRTYKNMAKSCKASKVYYSLNHKLLLTILTQSGCCSVKELRS